MELGRDYSAFFRQARDVYSWMADEESRKIFQARFTWSGVGTDETVSNIAQLSTGIVGQLTQKKNKLFDESSLIIMYGAMEIGAWFYHYHHLDQKNVIFCDRNYKNLPAIDGCEIRSPEDLKKLVTEENKDSCCAVICAVNGIEEIRAYLEEVGLKKESIVFSIAIDEERMYFEDFLPITESEVFVDCGSFDGFNSVQFTKHCSNPRILAVDADPTNIQKIESTFQKNQIKNYKIVPIGLWSEKKTLHFTAYGSGASRIMDEGSDVLECDCLDHLFSEEDVSFIKMDLEGAELEVLKGAKAIIKEKKPKLAISIYHKEEDILELPLYIKSIVPEYEFYLRHYTDWRSETVLYGIAKMD